MRQVFIYWKLPAAQAAAGAAAAQALQAGLQASHPALRAGLFRRSDATAGDPVTLMETYAAAGGVDDALLAEIVAAGDAALRPLGAPRRHVELFDELVDGRPDDRAG